MDYKSREKAHKEWEEQKVFNRYDSKKFIQYLDLFRKQDESINQFLIRIRETYNPSAWKDWERGGQPSMDSLKEIWWHLRFEGCKFSELVRLVYGFDCMEPTWDRQRRTK